MRLHWILGLILAALASAQLQQFISELPSCALTCISTALPISNCSITDLTCICASQPLWDTSEKCVEKSCTVREALTAQKVATSACDRPVRNRGLTIAIVGPTLTLISLLFVITRLTVRRPWPFSNGLFGWDDGMIVAAWLAGMPVAVFDGLYYENGLGQDIWLVPFDHITLLLKYFWAGEINYLLATVLVKISLLLFFLRIFPNHHFKLLCKVMIGVVVAFGIAFLFALTFQCSPVDYAWLRWDDPLGKNGSCVDVYIGAYMHAALNMALDVIILVMPMPLLYKLQFGYSIRQKVHVVIMFSFGLIATIVSILRLNSLLTFGKTHNPTWDYWAAAIWSPAEMHASIICACIPAAKVALVKVLPEWMVSFVSSTRGRSNNADENRRPSAAIGGIGSPPGGSGKSGTIYSTTTVTNSDGHSSDPLATKRNSRIKSSNSSSGFGVVSITSMMRGGGDESSGFTELVDMEDSHRDGRRVQRGGIGTAV